jgi:RNA polymerase sigma-70 factor (ECF subfamily)
LSRVAAADSLDGFDAEAVLAAASSHEQWAVAALFRAYQPRILRYLRAQAPGVADDLAGEVWVAVARGLDRFVGDEAGFRRWLFTIARRRLADHRRKVGRRRTDPVPHDQLDRPAEGGDGRDPASLVVDRLDAQQAIALIVTDLSPDQADAVLLRVVGGLDVAQVALVMDRSPGAVRVLCHRALHRLAPLLSEGVLAE